MKKGLIIFIGIILLIIIVFIVINLLPKKLVCKSKEGNITIIYDDKTITKYTVSGGITYNLEEGQEIAKKLGIEEYLNQFEKWFQANTTGKCTR